MSQFRECRLGDVLTLQRGFDLPAAQRLPGQVPVVSSSGITGYHSEAKVRGPGVVIGRYGTLGEVHFVQQEFWPLNTSLYVKDFKSNHVRFCSYLLRTIKIAETSSTAAVPGVNRNVLHEMPVRCPPLPIQRRIASILGAYDDLIEVNRRRIALLEEMARRLFEEWFVRFRFPSHERSAMKDGRPEGWQQVTLGELAEVRLGKMLDAAKNRGELRPYLANVNVRWGSIDLSELRSMRFEPDEAEKYGLAYGDIVMCEGGEPGRCAMWKDEAPQMMLQKALHRIRSKPDVDRNYLFHYLLFTAKSQRLSSLFTGSTIKHLPREKLLSLRIEVPPNHLLEQFGRLVTPIEAQIGTLQAAIRRLQEMRDMLLPRLISGELSVAAAERELEAAA